MRKIADPGGVAKRRVLEPRGRVFVHFNRYDGELYPHDLRMPYEPTQRGVLAFRVSR